MSKFAELNTPGGLKRCADALTAAMRDQAFYDAFSGEVLGSEKPPQPHILLADIERRQCQELAKLGYTAYGGTSDNGEKALNALKSAVKSFPQNAELRESIVQLCNVEELYLQQVQQAQAKKLGLPIISQQQQMQMMQQAMMALPAEKREFAQKMQTRMMESMQKRQPPPTPTPDEQATMMEIQKHVTAYMQTMMEVTKMQYQMAMDQGKAGGTE